jgi:anti-anti-sigma factor
MNATFAEPARGAFFELREHDGVLVLELRGELGSLGWHPNDEDLESAVFSAFGRMRRPRMVVDLSEVTYAGSEFVGFLLGLWKHLQARGGRLGLTGVQGNVSEILHTLRLDRVLPQHPSVEAALEAVSDR